MPEPRDPSEIDQAYREAARAFDDAAGVQRRRQAVLAAVAAAQAKPGAVASAPTLGPRPASNEPRWHPAASWWRGAAAACVLLGSAMLVTRLADEPGAPVEAPRPAPADAGQIAPAIAPAAVTPPDARAFPDVPARKAEGRAAARVPVASAAPAAPAAEARTAPEADTAQAVGTAAAPAAPVPPAAPVANNAAAMPMAEPATADASSGPRAGAARGAVAAAKSAPSTAPAPAPAPMAQMDALRPAFSAQREQRIAPPPRQVGPDDERDADGRTALTLAVLRNDAGAVKLLLDRGADRQARDRFGQTPQGYALAAGDPAVLGAFGLTPASRPLQSSP